MIDFFDHNTEEKPVFSIIIPTWNNLAFLKLCIASLRKNSFYRHQIIVHVNENADNTKKWLDKEHLSHSLSGDNVGVCYALNAAYSLAKSDYILYMNDDMYACPNWDVPLKKQADQMPDFYFYLSASLIEPVDSGNKSVLAPYNFGQEIESFREEELLKNYEAIPTSDKNGASWPPSLMHRKLWNLIGGFSTEFFPGMYSDPDISMKMWQLGVRHFQIVGDSKIYHFMSKTTGKVKKNNGKKQFLQKWGVGSSTFYKYYLRMGTEFKGKLDEPVFSFKLKAKILLDKIKNFLSF